MKNHRLIDICKYHHKLHLKREVLIAGFQCELPLNPNSPHDTRSTMVSTYLHDGDIDMEAVVSLNIGIEENRLRGMLLANANHFNGQNVLADFNPN